MSKDITEIKELFTAVTGGGRITAGRKSQIVGFCKRYGVRPPTAKQCRNCWVDALVQCYRIATKKEHAAVKINDDLKKYRYVGNAGGVVVGGVVINEVSGNYCKQWLLRVHPNLFRKIFKQYEND